jgi:hypothetical protein
MKQVENGDANASNEQQLRKMDAVIRGSVPHQKRVEVMTDLTSSQLDTRCVRVGNTKIYRKCIQEKIGSQTQATKMVSV